MQALRFIVLSGAGWVLDLAIFTALVHGVALPAGIANLISASLAAISVYLVSVSLVFRVKTASNRSTAIYFLYTELGIAFWALVIQGLATLLGAGGFAGDAALCAVLAKILVTPFSLACNFVVAKYLATRAWSN